MVNTATQYKVTYNGYTVEFFESYEDVTKYMEEILEKYKDLNPREIYRGYAADNNAPNPCTNLKSVVIFQYNTLYTEVFMIEER